VADESKLGSTLSGYRLEQVLGRGGMGVVYMAYDERLGRRVALKLIAPELVADARLRARFLAESKLAASLDHPNVVPVYEAGEADGVLFLAMQLVEGRDLRAVLLARGVMPPDQAVPIIAQVASALSAAHAKGLVHRDVKPSNILLTPGATGDHAYLSDFGLCKAADTKVEVTVTGQTLGTVDYMAPEQIRGEHIDGRADVYALACVAFQCVSGMPPFVGGDMAVMVGHLEHEPPPLRADRALNQVLQRALAKRPDDRWPTADAFAGALKAALATPASSGSEDVPEPIVPVPTHHRGRRRLSILATAVGLVACATLIGFVALRSSEPASHAQAPSRLRVESTVPLGEKRAVLAAGPSGVYVIRRTRSAGTVSRIDERSGQLMPGVHLGYVPVGIAVGSDYAQAWILAVESLRSTSSVLLKLDSGRALPVQRSISIPGAPGCIDYPSVICNPALGGGSIWLPVGSTVYRIDGSGQHVQDKILLEEPIGDITYGQGALWVLSGNRLIRIDASDGSQGQLDLADRLGPDASPRQLALAGEQLWIRYVGPAGSGLARVPVATPTLGVATVVRFVGALTIASDGSALWGATSEHRGDVTQLDTRTGEPIGTSLALGSSPAWLAVVRPGAWLITRRSDSSRQLLHVVPR
jgi:serine/threonine protein kinase